MVGGDVVVGLTLAVAVTVTVGPGTVFVAVTVVRTDGQVTMLLVPLSENVHDPVLVVVAAPATPNRVSDSATTATPDARSVLLLFISYAAIGERDTVSEVRVNVLPETHACDAVSSTDKSKLPAVTASHTEMWVRVSDVPPFVHTGLVPVRAIALPEGAANANVTRVAEPTAAAVAPAAPGSAV
jgi:hypothetical protein